MIRAGEMRNSITFMSPVDTKNSIGETKRGYTSYVTRKAFVKIMGGARAVSSDLNEARQQILFIVRYDSKISAVSSDYRISYSGKTYEIENIDNVDFKNSEVKFYVRESN